MLCWKLLNTIPNTCSTEAIMNTGKRYHSMFLATFVQKKKSYLKNLMVYLSR